MPSDRARPMAQISPSYTRPLVWCSGEQSSARVIPLRPKIARRLPSGSTLCGPVVQPRSEVARDRASTHLGSQQSAALRRAVAFARAVMAEADAGGQIDYYDRWGNKVCLKP